jgi:TPR repeat protein
MPVQKWKFQPATKDGKPATVQINIEINFLLYLLYGTPAGNDFGRLVARADAGDTKSQLKLGRALLTGDSLPKNELEGLSWLQRAANRDVPEAQFRIAEYLYSHARNPSDYIAAYIWCYRAQHNRYKQADKMLEKIATKLSPSDLADAEIRTQQG